MTVYRRKIPKVYLPIFEARRAGRTLRHIGLHGGRGSSKSHFAAEEVVQAMAAQETRVVCIREIQKSLEQSVKRLLEDKIRVMGLSHRFRITDRYIEVPDNGSHAIFQGMQNHTADSIKSLEGYDIAWPEEAQSLSQRSLTLLRPTIRKPGSYLLYTYNPNSPTDPVDTFLRGPDAIDDPEIMTIQVNWRDNPFFPEVLRKEMERDKKRSDPGLYNHVWEGAYANASSAAVFRNWREQEFEAPAGTIFYFGGDWGFAQDPSVLVRMFIVGRTIFIDYEAYAVGCDIDKTPFLFAGTQNEEVNSKNRAAFQSLTVAEKEAWQGIPKATEFTIRADSARPETISYMQKHGFPRITPAIKGAGSVEEGVEFLKTFDIVIHPRCKHTLNEFKFYSYKVDPHTEEVTSVLADKENHVIDACLVGGTVVETADGPAPISSLVGTSGMVHSVDPDTGEACIRSYSDVRMTRANADVVRIELEDGRSIDLTADHVVLTRTGWKEAGKLTQEDEILDLHL